MGGRFVAAGYNSSRGLWGSGIYAGANSGADGDRAADGDGDAGPDGRAHDGAVPDGDSRAHPDAATDGHHRADANPGANPYNRHARPGAGPGGGWDRVARLPLSCARRRGH